MKDKKKDEGDQALIKQQRMEQMRGDGKPLLQDREDQEEEPRQRD